MGLTVYGGGDCVNITPIIIPAGRMRGDVDGDGKFTFNPSDFNDLSTDYGLISSHIAKTSLLTDETQLLCADVNGDGNIRTNDRTILQRFIQGYDGYYAGGLGPEVTGNWTNNPNYATEEGQFYTDIPIIGMTANHSASVIVKGTYESGFFTKAECVEGAIRIYAKLCPISALTAVVSWGSGNGTAVITTESEDLTEYAEHVDDTTIHLPAVTTDDNGKILRVVDGVWTAVTPS